MLAQLDMELINWIVTSAKTLCTIVTDDKATVATWHKYVDDAKIQQQLSPDTPFVLYCCCTSV